MSLGFFLVDDHEAVRRGLIDLLCADPELDCVGEAGSVAEAMSKIPVASPDVAVVDDWLPDGHGVQLCRDLRSSMPDLRCLILTSHSSDEAMLYAILAGGSGYVVKDIKGMQLASAVKDVGAGRSLLDPRATAALMERVWRIAEDNDGRWGLDDRDRALLSLLGDGLTDRQIAERTRLAEDLVRKRVSRVLVKLGVTRYPYTLDRQWF
ncbi:DNA-binding response regulator [Mycobacterium sp. 852002-50816_SCH5313054-b]|uniref:response regulator transcription factor n=1 Tax=Mycobacterium sp. 852002-50816_SCH5313054-b TaxID=1834092 RepID=UPI0007FB8C17|nr:response regulator transcription factor [Mycobacterium sp. 852002-50816_SCH5313054-b]OBF53216.1 DNA-binding response regulator [Mycobacterium sp. 852002-50816_SCH5313054-b]